MSKPIIGILLRPIKKSTVLKDDSRTKTIKAGGIPLGIAMTASENYSTVDKLQDEINSEVLEDLFAQLDLCDGLLLQGGKNMYKIEAYAAKYALEKEIPTFGICLGMQHMAYMGGALIEQLPTDNHAKGNRDNFEHVVKIKANTRLSEIIKQAEIPVNTAHNDYIPSLEKTGLIASAYSVDSVIEALEKEGDHYFVGVQWHPETLTAVSSTRLFNSFVEAAAEYKDTKIKTK